MQWERFLQHEWSLPYYQGASVPCCPIPQTALWPAMPAQKSGHKARWGAELGHGQPTHSLGEFGMEAHG